jgi:hypothetical protein
MTKTGWALAIGALLIIVAAIILFVLPGKTTAPTTGEPQATTTPDIRPTLAGRVVVESVKNGDKVSSPLTVTGTARGWYFEASFPVELRNASGTIIAQGPATAQGDWMVDAFVPFSITLTFPAQATSSTGTLILRNDNPSGLPENDESLSIPVVF